MRFSQILYAAAWLCFEGASAAPLDIKALLSTTKWSNNTILSFPNSQQFTDVTERWTIFDPPTYVAAISPGSEDDVVKAVSESQISFTYTGMTNKVV